MTITSLQTYPHCKWQDAVKGSVFLNKALVCDICQHNFPANFRYVRETFYRCNRCGFISHWRQRNRVRRDYYPSDGEEENDLCKLYVQIKYLFEKFLIVLLRMQTCRVFSIV